VSIKLPELREKEIFRELVGTPNRVPGVQGLQAALAERYGVTVDTLKAIERKGMARDWPPLD
jgi:hypothetical protein